MAKSTEERSLVIVESPTKAKTISRFLGKGFIVMASNGHVRDLPNNAAEVPEKLKKESWAKLGVHIENDFSPLYVVPDSKKRQVKELRQAMKDVQRIYLATDEDREGESISWHLLEVLKPKVPVSRLVFHEITQTAIQHALDSARDIDQDLVNAQETRRVVDRLFGLRSQSVAVEEDGAASERGPSTERSCASARRTRAGEDPLPFGELLLAQGRLPQAQRWKPALGV